MPQLLCQNLAVGYDGKTVVSGLNFEVCAGDYLCIVGENGAGKSTLVKTLMQLQSPLSGSQQQRVLLARALCAARKMLLLDEPAAGLDPKVTAELYSLIEKLNREDGVTILMISHDIHAAVRYASHILHIGQEVFFGTKEAYLQSSQGQSFVGRNGGAA